MKPAQDYLPKYIEYVYCLRNPFTLDIFYVGRTKDLSTRLKGHLADGRSYLRGDKPLSLSKSKYISEILNAGRNPVIQILEWFPVRLGIDEKEVAHREIHWMKWFIKIGWQLTNVNGPNVDENYTSFSWYKKAENKSHLSNKDFYYGTDKYGSKVYDFKRAKQLGFNILNLDALENPPSPLTYDNDAYSDLRDDINEYFD